MKSISSEQVYRIKELLSQSTDGVYYGEYGENDDYQIAYQTSKLRENLVNWYEFDSNAEILVIENGCGALLPYFSQKLSKVDVIQNNKIFNEIIADRCDNVNIIEQSLDKFDIGKKYKYIFVDDDFQFIHHYGFTLEKYIEFLMSLLDKKGVLLIASVNRLALRNFNGWFENKTLFSQLKNNVEEAKICYTKSDFETILAKLNIANYKFYYPFPYKDFPRTIFTDESNHFMDFGHHYNSIGNDRYKFFDERRMYGELQNANIVEYFSNCFLVEIGKKQAQLCQTVFAKNQYYIGKKYKVVTKIYKENNEYYAIKIPLSKEAKNHLEEFYNDSLQMKSTQHFNYIHYTLETDGSLKMPFIKGKSLSKVLSNCLYEYLNNTSQTKEILYSNLKNELTQLYDSMKSDAVLCTPDNIYNEEFKKYYGNKQIDQSLLCFETSTLDLHLDHIYKKSNGTYNVIDLDPIALFNVPIDYLMWSVIESWIYTYVKNNKSAEKVISTKQICELIGLNTSFIEIFNMWKGNHFSDNNTKSQLVPFYSKEYLPKFVDYSCLKDAGILKNSNDRRTEYKNNDCYFEMTPQSNFIIYGASAIGGAVKKILNYYNYGHILGFIDKRHDEISFAHDLPVWSIEDAPKNKDIIVYIGIKNVFEQEDIAKLLVEAGYHNILFMPQAIIRGEYNPKLKSISDVYDFIINLKGKDLSKIEFLTTKRIPQTIEFEKIELKDNGIVSKKDNQYIVNMPVQYLFTAQQHLNPGYPWAEQSIISLVPHTLLYNYLWNGGDDCSPLYVNFCAYGARNSGVKMTEGWKRNLIENRLTVLSAMKKSLEEDFDFFMRNAPEAVYNSEFNYFNMNGGRHRAALFVFENFYKMPVVIKKESYERFVNKDVIKEIEQLLNNVHIELINPIAHPYFYSLNSKRPQYYQLVIKKLIEFLSKKSLEVYDYIDFKNHNFALVSSDHGELKRTLYSCHFGINQINETDEFENLLDKLFYIKDNKYVSLNECDYLFIDETMVEINNCNMKLNNISKFEKIFILKERFKDSEVLSHLDLNHYHKNILTSSFFDGKHIEFLCFERGIE